MSLNTLTYYGNTLPCHKIDSAFVFDNKNRHCPIVIKILVYSGNTFLTEVSGYDYCGDRPLVHSVNCKYFTSE